MFENHRLFLSPQPGGESRLTPTPDRGGAGPGVPGSTGAGTPPRRPGGGNGTFSHPEPQGPAAGHGGRREASRGRTEELYHFTFTCHHRRNPSFPLPTPTKRVQRGQSRTNPLRGRDAAAPGAAVRAGQPRTPPHPPGLRDKAALIPHPGRRGGRPRAQPALSAGTSLLRPRRPPAPFPPGQPLTADEGRQRPRHSPHMVAPHDPPR